MLPLFSFRKRYVRHSLAAWIIQKWYTQALRKTGAWSELQLFMEEQLESGSSDATTARGLIAESLFQTGDDESGSEVLLRVESQDRDRACYLVWDKSAALGRSESAYEAQALCRLGIRCGERPIGSERPGLHFGIWAGSMRAVKDSN